MLEVGIGFLVTVLGGVLWLFYNVFKVRARNREIEKRNKAKIIELVKGDREQVYPSKPHKPSQW